MADEEEREESGAVTEGAENVAESLANTVAPGAVVTNVEPIVEEIREGFRAVTSKLDALTEAQPVNERPPGSEEEIEADESPIKPPWTHRRLWKREG